MFGRKKVLKADHPVHESPKIHKSSNNSQSGFIGENEHRLDTKMTYLTSDCEITGTIKFDGSMRIDGNVEGKIMSDKGELVIGKTGTAKAAINIRSVVIEGRVVGNIKATDKVVLKQKAHLIGDLKAKTLVVEAGVIFVGRCNVNHE